jgi:translation initiation factor 3 subunit A
MEPIMLKYLELCVDMKKGKLAKDGLLQYKNIVQNVDVSSLEVLLFLYF